MPTVYNAANEKAVDLFLNRKIKYLYIVELIKSALDNHKFIENPTITQILECEQETYDYINNLIL